MIRLSGQHWRARTPTKRGRIDPPRFAARIFATDRSTVQGRLQQRAHEEKLRDNVVVLAPGMLVIHDFRPYRVVEIREVPAELWGERWDAAWKRRLDDCERHGGDVPERASWTDRPVVMVLADPQLPGAESLHLQFSASLNWDVLPEHYAVCVACGELPPCRHEVEEEQVSKVMGETERRMQIPAGACLGCGEPISGRMKSVRFPGANLWRPDLGNGSAVFHARQECSGWVEIYREQWQRQGIPEAQAQLPLGDGEAGR